MEQWQTALNRVIVCLVILFIEHEHILPKKAPHPLRIRCLFYFWTVRNLTAPSFVIFQKDFVYPISRIQMENRSVSLIWQQYLETDRKKQWINQRSMEFRIRLRLFFILIHSQGDDSIKGSRVLLLRSNQAMSGKLKTILFGIRLRLFIIFL